MKKCKKLGVFLLAAVLLLAAIPVAMMPAAAAVDASALDVQLDFVSNARAKNALYATNGIDYDSGAYATKEYNYIVVKTLSGSAAVATFTIPEGAAAPIFRASTVGDALWQDVTATEAVDGTTRTYTIESIGAANAFLQISFPICDAENYRLTALAFDSVTVTHDYSALYSADTYLYTSANLKTLTGAYDAAINGTRVLYHKGQARLNMLSNSDLIYKTAPNSAFKLYATRAGADVRFSVSPDGVNWKRLSNNFYTWVDVNKDGTEDSYDTHTYYFPAIGENNQFVKVSFVDTNDWSAYVGVYNVSYEKATDAVLLNDAERNTTDNAFVPSSSTVDISTLNVYDTFVVNDNPLPYVAGGSGYAVSTDWKEGGKLTLSTKSAYAIFKTAYNSPFVVWVQHYGTVAASASAEISVSPTGLDGSWTVIKPTSTERAASSIASRGWQYVFPAIGGKNQYVKVQLPNDTESAFNSIAGIAYNKSEPTFKIDYQNDTTLPDLGYTSDLSKLEPYGLVSYDNTGSYQFDSDASGNRRMSFFSGNCELVFKTAPGSPLSVKSLQHAKKMVFYASPTGEADTWVKLAPLSTYDSSNANTGGTHNILSIGVDNQYVKITQTEANTSQWAGDIRMGNIQFTRQEPDINTVTVQDVALTTDVAATAIDATVAYDSNKLEYKGYYGAVGTATVTDNGGSLSVNVTADAANSGDWIKLVFLPKDGIQGSAMVEVTAITATGADLTVGQCPIWYETPATEGNVLVEFDYGTTSSALDTVAEGAAGAALSYPAAPERDGYVFGGWYDLLGNPYVAETYPAASTRVVAKWLDADTLTVGAQITDGTTSGSAETNLRISSTVDSLQYESAGFIIKIGENGTPKACSTTTVYSILKGAGEDYTPWENFSADSRYFFAFNIYSIPTSAFDTTITVTPFWVTYDGATVTGTPRELTVNGLING